MELVRPTFKSTDNINIDDAQSKPRRNISQDDKRCRQYLSKHLSTAANCQQCLIDGIKNHTHMVELNGHKKREIKLPEPCFTLDNPSLFTEQDYNSKSGSLSTEDELDDMPITNIEETDDKGTQELGGSEAEPIDPNPPEPSPYGAGWFGIFMGKFKVKLTAIKQLLSSASLHLPKASSITLVIAVSALAIMGISVNNRKYEHNERKGNFPSKRRGRKNSANKDRNYGEKYNASFGGRRLSKSRNGAH